MLEPINKMKVGIEFEIQLLKTKFRQLFRSRPIPQMLFYRHPAAASFEDIAQRFAYTHYSEKEIRINCAHVILSQYNAKLM